MKNARLGVALGRRALSLAAAKRDGLLSALPSGQPTSGPVSR